MKYTQKAAGILHRNNICSTFSCIAVLVFLLWLLVGCSKKEDEDPIKIAHVLLVYLAVDNDLSGESYSKLEAIRRGWKSQEDTRILVYQDARGAAPRLMEITENNSIKVIESYESENSANPAVFGRVITNAKAMYPQAGFNLLVFSHASGWLPKNMLATPRAVLQTRTILADGNDSMELTDFAAAIPDHAFDYIIFEACFMAGIEVAYQLKNKANYIAASSAEILSPGFEIIYSQHINELVYGAPEKFMQAAFNYFNNKSEWERSATFSIIRTGNLEALANYIKSNCDFAQQIPIAAIQYFDRNSYRLFGDFQDYYSRLLNTDQQRLYLQQLIDDVVVWKVATPDFMLAYSGFVINKHSGMTTYIMQDRYPVLNRDYTITDWYKAINND